MLTLKLLVVTFQKQAAKRERNINVDFNVNFLTVNTRIFILKTLFEFIHFELSYLIF